MAKFIDGSFSGDSTLPCIASHCIALHCLALHCIALHFLINAPHWQPYYLPPGSTHLLELKGVAVPPRVQNQRFGRRRNPPLIRPSLRKLLVPGSAPLQTTTSLEVTATPTSASPTLRLPLPPVTRSESPSCTWWFELARLPSFCRRDSLVLPLRAHTAVFAGSAESRLALGRICNTANACTSSWVLWWCWSVVSSSGQARSAYYALISCNLFYYLWSHTYLLFV